MKLLDVNDLSDIWELHDQLTNKVGDKVLDKINKLSNIYTGKQLLHIGKTLWIKVRNQTGRSITNRIKTAI
jgi:hypothetical protein